MIKEITDKTFEESIKNGYSIVDFWATWCGPCKMLSPIIEEISQELNKKLNFYKFDVDSGSETPEKFEIMSVPTLIIFKDGKLISKKIGLMPKSAIIDWIESNIK